MQIGHVDLISKYVVTLMVIRQGYDDRYTEQVAYGM